jgi:transglycosylase-like protein
VPRLLTKRTYVVPALVAAIAFPAAALAAGNDGALPRVAVADAKPVKLLAPLNRPSLRFQRAIRVHVQAIRAAERKRRREAFASLPGGVSQATLDAIAACESGGDPTIVSADGSYRGKYQFSFSTWASVGGSGDPAVASEAEQDYRAALLYSIAGSSPWPVCGA